MRLEEDRAREGGRDGHQEIGDVDGAGGVGGAELEDRLRVGRGGEMVARGGDGAEDFAGEVGAGRDEDGGGCAVDALGEEDDFAVGVFEKDRVDGGAVVVRVWERG